MYIIIQLHRQTFENQFTSNKRYDEYIAGIRINFELKDVSIYIKIYSYKIAMSIRQKVIFDKKTIVA